MAEQPWNYDVGGEFSTPRPSTAPPQLPSDPSLGELQSDYAATEELRKRAAWEGLDPNRDPSVRYPSLAGDYALPAGEMQPVPTDPLGERQLWLEWKAAHDNALATGQMPPPPPKTEISSPFAPAVIDQFAAGLERAEDRAKLEQHLALARMADLRLDPNKIVGAFQMPISPGSFAEAKVAGGMPTQTRTVFQYEGETREEAARRAVELEGLQRWVNTKYIAKQVLATNTLGVSNIALNALAGEPTATSPTDEVITEQILTPAQKFKAEWVYGLAAGLPAKAPPNLLFTAVRKVAAVELTEAVASNFTRAMTLRLGGDAVRTLTRGTLREADRAIKAAGGYIDEAGRVVIPSEASKAAVQRVREVLPKIAEEARKIQPELKLVMTQPKRAFDRFTSATATGIAGAATTAPYLASNVVAARTAEERGAALEAIPSGMVAGFALGFGIEGILGAFNKSKRPTGPIKLGEQLAPPRLAPDINVKRRVLPVPKTGNQPLDNELTGLVATIEQRIRHFDDPITASVVENMAVEQLELLDIAKEAGGAMGQAVNRNARAVRAKLEFLAEWSGDLPKLMELGMADPEIAAGLVHLGEAVDDTTLGRMATLKAKSRQSGLLPRGLPEEALLDPYKIDISEINSDDMTRRALAIDQAHMGATMPVGELTATKLEKLSDLDPQTIPIWHSGGKLVTVLDEQVVDLTDNLQGLDLPEDAAYQFEPSPIAPVKFDLKDGRLVADLADTRQLQREMLPLAVGDRSNLDEPGALLADVLEAREGGQLDAESFAPRLRDLRAEHTRQLPTIPHQARRLQGPDARSWLVKKTEAELLTEWYEQKAILDQVDELLKQPVLEQKKAGGFVVAPRATWKVLEEQAARWRDAVLSKQKKIPKVQKPAIGKQQILDKLEQEIRFQKMGGDRSNTLASADLNFVRRFFDEVVDDDLLENLRLFVKTEGMGVRGTYEPILSIATIFRRGGDENTVVHEIVHHLTKFLKPKLKDEILADFQRQYLKTVEKYPWIRDLFHVEIDGLKLRSFSLDEVKHLQKRYGNDLIDRFIDARRNPSGLYSGTYGKGDNILYRFANADEFFTIILTDEKIPAYFKELDQRTQGFLGHIAKWLRKGSNFVAGLFGRRPIDRALDQMIEGKLDPNKSGSLIGKSSGTRFDRTTALGKLGRSGMKKDDWAHLSDQEKADHFRIHIAGLVDEIRDKNLAYGANLLKMRLGKLVPTYANDGSVLTPSYARGWVPTAEQRTEIAAAYKAASEQAKLLGSASLKLSGAHAELTPDELRVVVEKVLSSGTQSLDAPQFAKLMGEMNLRDATRGFNTALSKAVGIFNEADLAAARQVEDLVNDTLNKIGVAKQSDLAETQGMPSAWAAAIKSASMLLRVPANFFIQHIPPAYSVGPMAELSTPGGVRNYIDTGAAMNDVFHLLRGNDQSGVIGKATFLHRTNQEIKPLMDHWLKNVPWSVEVFNAIDSRIDLSGPRGDRAVAIDDNIAKALGLPRGSKTATLRDFVRTTRALLNSVFDMYEQSQKFIIGRKEAGAGTQAEMTWDMLAAGMADHYPQLDYVAQLMKDTKTHDGRLLLMDTLYQEGRKLPEDVRQALELWRKFDKVRERHQKELELIRSGSRRREGYVPYMDSEIREYVRSAAESPYDSVINDNPEVYAPFFKERKGGVEPIADMYTVLSAYLPVAARKIFSEPTYYAVAEKIPQVDAPYRMIMEEFRQNLMGRQHPSNAMMKMALAADWAAGKMGLPPKVVPGLEATRTYLRANPRVGDPLNQIIRTGSTAVTLGAVNGTGLAALQLLENLNIPLQFASGGLRSYGKGLAYTAGFGLRSAGELAREKASAVRSWLTGSEQWQSLARKRGVEEMYHEFTENELRKNLSRRGVKRSDISAFPEKLYKLQFALQILADMHSRATGWYSFRQWGLDNGLHVGEAEQWAKLMVDKVFGDYGKTGQSPYTKGGLNPLFFMLKRFTIGKAAEFASDVKTALPQGRSTELVQDPAAHLATPVVEGLKETPFTAPAGGVEYQQAGFRAAQEGRISPEAAAMLKMDTEEIARVWWDQKRSTLAQRAARKKLLAHPATWAMQYYAAVNIFGLGNVGVLPIIGPVSSPVLDLGSDFVRGWQLWMDPSRDSREQRELNNLVATWPTRFLPFGSLLRTQRRIQNRLNDNAGLPQEPYGVWSLPGEYWDLFTRHPEMLIFPSQSVVPKELPPP